MSTYKHAKISKYEAYFIAKKMGVNFNRDFFGLSLAHKNELATLAKVSGYRKPDDGSGSLARYFFNHLVKSASKENWS